MKYLHASCIFAAALMSAGIPFLKSNAFDVVRDGRPAAFIDVKNDVPADVLTAVDEFIVDVRELTGAALPKKSSPGLNRVEVVYLKKNIADDDKVNVSFPGCGVMRVEAGGHGLMRVFPLLLERFGGVRYVFPTVKGTHYPASSNFTMPDKPFSFAPFFTYNRILTWDYAPWQKKLGRKQGVKCDHDIPMYIIPIKKYIKTGKWPDKTVFPIIKGRRLDMKADPDQKKYGLYFQTDWQPCLTSRASIDEAVKNIEDHIKRNPGISSISLTPNDGAGYCECEACARLNARKTPFRAYASYKDRANSYYYWCNEIIKRVSKKYPDMLFGSLAYRETHFVPDFKIHPNMLVYVCIDFGWGLYPDVMPKLKKDIEQFAAIGAKVGVWEYNWGEIHYSLPHYYPNQIAKMMRLLADNNYRAMFSEGNESVGEGPKRYVYLKLLENPYADVEKIKNEWFEACAGAKAAPYLKKYFEFWEYFWRERASKTAHADSRHVLYQGLGNLCGPFMNGLKKGDAARQRELMEKVVAAAESDGDSGQKIRAGWLYKAFEIYECQMIVSGGEILPDSGAVESAGVALELLRKLPEMVEADKKLARLTAALSTDPDLKWWHGIKRFAQRKFSGHYEYALGKCTSFASNPEVYAELRNIVKNKTLPRRLRMIAGAISKNGAAMMKNLLDDTKAGQVLLGVHEVELPVKHGEWLHDVPVNPGRYLVNARVEIPLGVVIPAEAWINLRIQGRCGGRPAGGFLDSPKLSPKPGKSYTLTNIYTIEKKADAIQIIVNLFHFKNGTKVRISDMRVIKM